MYGKNGCCPLGDPLEIPVIKGEKGDTGPQGPKGDSVIADLSNYLTKDNAESIYQKKGDYATISFVNEQIAANKVDLNNYYTKNNIDEKLS